MSFLAPWALGLASLAAIPLVLHLFHRDTRRRLAFPAIRYLRSARDRSARALKFRDRLLLAARVVLVLALAAAAAAPLAGRGDVSDHVPTDVVLVIDNTGSMNRVSGEATLLDRQRSRASELLGAARSGDRFWIIPAVGPLLASGVPADAATRAIGSVVATDATADLGSVVREAIRLLPPGSARPREIVVMSDLQASSVAGTRFELPADIRLVASVTESSEENGAVLEVQPSAPGPGADGAVFVVLAPRGELADTVEVRLVVEGSTVSIARAHSGGAAVLRLPDLGVGEHAIAVESPPSGLRSDDRRHFILRTFEPPAVHHVGPSDSYVARALATLARAGKLRLATTTESSAAWFVEGVSSTGLAGAADGAAWILTPPTDDDLLARFNAGLDRLGIPWRVDVVNVSGNLYLAPSPDAPGIESIQVRGRHRLRSTGAGSDTVILRTADDWPWLVSGRVDDRPYLLIGSPLVPEHTELPVTAAMLPLMETLLLRWAGLGGSLPSPVPAGLPSMLPVEADSVSRPGGGSLRVDGASPYVPLRAGIHTVYLASGDSSLLAATVPTSESDLRAASVADFGRALGSAGAVAARTEPEWRDAMYGRRRGAMISPYLLALALGLVLVEMALATPRHVTASSRRTRPEDRRP